MRVARRKKRKKRLYITISVISALLLTVCGYAFYFYKSATETAAVIHEEINREKSEKRTQEVMFQRQDPISILLMGVDERSGDAGRSDTLIVMAVNPNKQVTQMISIPRDTRTEIVGRGIEDKINHAYAFGGTEMTINTVENFLDIPVDYFMKLNMESFEDTVDALGGVQVNNTLDFSYGGYHFPKGTITLNGDKALNYTRMRKEDPRGDFGRQERQRQVIEAVLKKGATFTSFTKFGDIFKVIEHNVKTNLTLDQLWDIQLNYKEATQNVEQYHINGSGANIGGVYYFVVPEEERLALSSQLAEHLELQ